MNLPHATPVEQEHSDSPSCASGVLAAFVTTLNDSTLFAGHLGQLTPLAPRLVGTAASFEVEQRRMFLLVDWAMRIILPLTFDSINLPEVAATLRAFAPIVDADTARSATESAARLAAMSAMSAATSAESAESAARSAESAAWSAESAAWWTRAAAKLARPAAMLARSAQAAAMVSAQAAARSAAMVSAESARSAESAADYIRARTLAIFELAIALQ